MVESVEGSTMIPAFDDEEFALVMQDMDEIADRATKELQEIHRQERQRGRQS